MCGEGEGGAMLEYILKIGLNERTDVHAARMVDRVGGWQGAGALFYRGTEGAEFLGSYTTSVSF